MTTSPLFILPGWQNSGPSHWQSAWEASLGARRVEQNDWLWPLRGDWMARLDEVLADDARLAERPAVLVAHSLGCHLVAAWAAHSQLVARVRGALLVAPPDVERFDMPPQVHGWRPIVRRRLPFAATLVYSDDDPYAEPQRAVEMAQAWGATPHSIGACGHINGDSGLGDWPAGLATLRALCDEA